LGVTKELGFDKKKKIPEELGIGIGPQNKA
jgi:hypothetical protein